MSSPNISDKSRGRATSVPPLFFILAAAVLWSTGGLFIKWTSLSGFELSFGRSLLAAITVAIFTRREGFGLNRLTAVASVLYAVLLITFVLATKLTTAANAIFLQYTAPVYVLILEPIIYKEKFRTSDLITVIACVLGMSLFFVGKLRPEDVTGNLLALVSGFCFALYFLMLRHARAREVNRASSVIYGNLLVTVFTGMVGVEALRAISFSDAIMVSYLGIVQIGIAYTLFTLGMARGVRSLDAGIAGYIEPVLNPLWVFMILGEQPSGWAIVGGAIIVSAVVTHTVLNARKLKKLVAD